MIPGKHQAKVVTCTYGHSSQKLTPQFEVVFLVDDATGGEQITGYIYLTEKAMGIARKSLKAMGFNPDDQELDVLVKNPALLAGNEAQIVVVEEEGQDGEYRMKVAFINPLPGPADANELKKLSKALRDVKGSTKPKKAVTLPASKTLTAEIEKHFTGPGGTVEAGQKLVKKTEGDDIPF